MNSRKPSLNPSLFKGLRADEEAGRKDVEAGTADAERTTWGARPRQPPPDDAANDAPPPLSVNNAENRRKPDRVGYGRRCSLRGRTPSMTVGDFTDASVSSRGAERQRMPTGRDEVLQRPRPAPA